MKNLTLILVMATVVNAFGQEAPAGLQSILRIKFLNPGIELEQHIAEKSTIAVSAGVGMRASQRNLSFLPGTSLAFYLAPFVDVSYKRFYHRDQRQMQGKSLAGNSGNYWGVRLLTNFKEIESEDLIRYANTDFALGPRWGMQRTVRNLHFLFDLGPVYFVDVQGNRGLLPLMIQLNLGYNARAW